MRELNSDWGDFFFIFFLEDVGLGIIVGNFVEFGCMGICLVFFVKIIKFWVIINYVVFFIIWR